MAMPERPRVLIVDDSAVVGKLLAKGFAAHGLEVVGVAADPFIARDLIQSQRPDVLTLDIEMPRMNGLSFLERLMAFHPMPVVVLSSLTQDANAIALRALELGAIEVLAKHAHDWIGGSASEGLARAAATVKLAAGAKVGRRWSPLLKKRLQSRQPLGGPAQKLLALGASTGGTQALGRVLAALPRLAAGCVIVQHMPADFMEGFAANLARVSDWDVRVARPGDLLREGEVLLAPGDRHLVLERAGGGWVTALRDSPPVNFVRPSVDVMMLSAARAAGPAAVGAILTGMGKDGARGLLAMRQAGARTLVQDEASSAIFGMPKECLRLGATDLALPLEDLAAGLEDLVNAAPLRAPGWHRAA
jgi:two-component system chemotaxis response regulator CheB